MPLREQMQSFELQHGSASTALCNSISISSREAFGLYIPRFFNSCANFWGFMRRCCARLPPPPLFKIGRIYNFAMTDKVVEPKKGMDDPDLQYLKYRMCGVLPHIVTAYLGGIYTVNFRQSHPTEPLALR